MVKYENLSPSEKIKKQKALIKLLNTGLDKETKIKRDAFMQDTRKKYANKNPNEKQFIYID